MLYNPERQVIKMKEWLLKTAWPMTPPSPFSLFHVVFFAAGFLVSMLAAYRLRRLPEHKLRRLLSGVGFFLCASEAYKQLFLYYIVNQGQYDWWYFPFQLCSLPMYLCTALLFIPSPGARRNIYTFLYDYNLLGALMVFVDPSGLMHPFWTLTIHSFLWHIVIIFAGLLILASGQADVSLKGYCKATALFAASALAAIAINVLAHPFGNADMFYISPYYPTTQFFYSWVAEKIGLWGGNLFYLSTICLGAGILHVTARKTGAS